jgi:hydroxyethylthiazole kinase-like uncharacterized protein yjeF
MAGGKERLKVVTVEQMRAIERAADAGGLSYSTMMENAGRAVASWLQQQAVRGQQFLVLVGPGNNGGDGLVAARYLHQAGATVSVYSARSNADKDENWKLAQGAGVPIHRSEEDEGGALLRRLAAQADWIVDALLGTGVSRPIAGRIREILAVVHEEAGRREGHKPDAFAYPALSTSTITASSPKVLSAAKGQVLSEAKGKVLALDVPSGLNCDTGAIDAAALTADVTVTLAFPKVGQFLFPGASHGGELVIADIGIPAELARDIPLEVSTPQTVQLLLPKRPRDSHKGTFGKAMVVAGSANYTGAPYLAASAAMRVGAGLVTLAIAELLHPILAAKLTEATYLVLPHEMGALVPEAVKVLQEKLPGYDALLLGPGLGHEEKTVEFVARLLALPQAEKKARLGFIGAPNKDGWPGSPLPPVVIDADALNALADLGDWHKSLRQKAVLTPHPGEMSRLMGISIAEVEANRLALAVRAAKEWGVVVVLKGAYTVIAAPDGRACINPFATPALATAGTGDVLAGAVVGLLAQGLAPFGAAVAGAYLHGLAGQMVSEEIGLAGAVAGDLLARLPRAIAALGRQ